MIKDDGEYQSRDRCGRRGLGDARSLSQIADRSPMDDAIGGASSFLHSLSTVLPSDLSQEAIANSSSP